MFYNTEFSLANQPWMEVSGPENRSGPAQTAHLWLCSGWVALEIHMLGVCLSLQSQE
jgi:hypothetical protein